MIDMRFVLSRIPSCIDCVVMETVHILNPIDISLSPALQYCQLQGLTATSKPHVVCNFIQSFVKKFLSFIK